MTSSDQADLSVSVLQKVGRGDVVADPFPHVVVEDALPDELCQRLLQEFPPLDVVTEGASYSSNERFSYSAGRAVGDPAVSQARVVDELLA